MPSPSIAKNQMGRAIESILDPMPRRKDEIWAYFESRCAYCGTPLSKTDREGHIDHATSGDGNHLGNLVLACSPCNGDEKLDTDWRGFLDQKVSDPHERRVRMARIEAWQTLHPRLTWTPTAEVESIHAELREMVVAFGIKCAELRQAVAAAKAASAEPRS